MAAYTLKDVSDSFWAKVKSHAALKQITIQRLIINLLQKELGNEKENEQN